ncbi:hypothetical protein ASPVEDRAFT_44666 [Aspergillus versicolor CBS 583.65]|uniref:Uncharacterized protein n=1 Tax=Aspergillus versicolor CBS 583.65 TaxID=1036611 RepID=A0A1L9PUJ4_ASPVE|nr:uncharacterized protein ASPVEDRAFT_44666 [Aspergillus versicolor CBS 583.65]OJJ05143.1 hypothetical protein ASPVEDRAFT_44666 [Aspergillus versicolor CBS 583.65]
MSLSAEAIIALFALFVACVPAVCCIIRHQTRPGHNRHHNPETDQSDPPSLRPRESCPPFQSVTNRSFHQQSNHTSLPSLPELLHIFFSQNRTPNRDIESGILLYARTFSSDRFEHMEQLTGSITTTGGAEHTDQHDQV